MQPTEQVQIVGIPFLCSETCFANSPALIGHLAIDRTIMKAVLTRLFDRDIYHDCEMQLQQIEDYPAGYPRLSALLASHDSFQIYRRFSRLRARLLLLKQDKVSALEQRLDRIDRDESTPLFLGSSRDDANAERAAILLELDKALENYDHLLERSARALGSERAEPRNIRSVQNWVNGTGCLSWEESDYLTHCRDLHCLAQPKDSAAIRIEVWVENALVWLSGNRRMKLFNVLSRDRHVFVSNTSIASTITRLVIVSILVILISLPIIICVFVDSTAARITAVILSLVVFLIILSALVTRKTLELILAGATYTTVLVVFVSETSSNVR